jgi:probable F420-dependent oxidoreductase
VNPNDASNLGFYTLAGAPPSARAVVDEVRVAEELGLGHVFVSERFNVKEAATVSAAAAAVSDHIDIATAATNHNTRHPLVTASWATTMHSLSGGRFTLGLGRGFDRMFDAMALPRVTSDQLEDFVSIMRRLWSGETILGHDGPAGRWPYLDLGGIQDLHIPVGLVAIGPNSLALGGRVFDQVVLHTFFTDETTARCVATVKQAAEQAGRNPDDVAVWSCFATIGDHIPEEARLRKTVGRLAAYLQGYGDLLVRTNGWDERVLERFRSDDVVQGITGAIDGVDTSISQLEHIATLIPDDWLAPMAAGSPTQCVSAIRNQFALGCDGVIMHGASPSELTPIVREYTTAAAS